MLANKEFSWYWNIIKIPILIAVIVMILSFALTSIQMLVPFLPILSALMWIIKLSVITVLSAYVGWTAVKKYNAEIVHYCIAGGLFGLILGALSAILTLISSTLMMAGIGVLGNNMAVAGAFGVMGFLMGFITAGFTFVFTFCVGLVLALIGGLIAQNTK